MLKTKLFHSQGPRASDFSRFALIGFVCLAFFSQSFGVAAKYGQLSIKNGHFVNATGQNVQLKGMSMYAWTPAAIGFYNTTAIGHLCPGLEMHRYSDTLHVQRFRFDGST